MTGDSSSGESDISEIVESVLLDYPVSVGILFGSRARGEAHEQSDIDVAVAFETLEPGDPRYNDVFFGLSADLAATLGTDDVDVVDLRQAPPELARAAFEDGTVLVGSDTDVDTLREECLETADEDRSPADRFDDVLADIDDHLA